MPSLRVSKQNGLTLQEYSEAMMMELESTDDRRIQAFNYMLIQENKVAQTYNKRFKRKSFEVGELVRKIILPPKTKNWANGLPTGRDLSRCIKYYLEMHTS